MKQLENMLERGTREEMDTLIQALRAEDLDPVDKQDEDPVHRVSSPSVTTLLQSGTPHRWYEDCLPL